jgi:hypothetical protein
MLTANFARDCADGQHSEAVTALHLTRCTLTAHLLMDAQGSCLFFWTFRRKDSKHLWTSSPRPCKELQHCISTLYFDTLVSTLWFRHFGFNTVFRHFGFDTLVSTLWFEHCDLNTLA